ncbi:MAG: MarR family transcriptional regulator [Bradymonadales bacterium]|nr:MarR family transcriptional regulator [Bradymonadales bacterium]
MERSRFEQSISDSLRRISRALDQYSHQLTRQYGLTGPQLACLRYLVQVQETNSSHLARAVSLSQPTVTGILDRLEARGLVTRTRDTEDRRAVILRPTAEGTAMADQAPSLLPTCFSESLSKKHEGAQALFDWVLRRLAAMMGGSEEEITEEEEHLCHESLLPGQLNLAEENDSN